MKSTFINMSLNLIYLVWIRSVKIIISCFFVLFRLQKWMRFGVTNTACLNKATVMLTWLKDDDSCLSTCMNWKRVEKVSMAYSICRVWHNIPFVVFLRLCFVGSKAKLIKCISSMQHKSLCKKASGKCIVLSPSLNCTRCCMFNQSVY